jgi:peroxiredoxin Q/BCP
MSSDYEAAGAAIVGVSLDDVESHQAFADKYSLPFPLLADTDAKGLDGLRRVQGKEPVRAKRAWASSARRS